LETLILIYRGKIEDRCSCQVI